MTERSTPGDENAAPSLWDRVARVFRRSGRVPDAAPASEYWQVQSELSRVRAERDLLIKEQETVQQAPAPALGASGAEVLTAVTRAEMGGVRDVFDVALELVERQCGAASSIVVPLADGGIEYLAHRGWPASELARRLKDARISDYVNRGLSEGEIVNGFMPGLGTPDFGPVVVCPLLDGNGVVRGLLCLDEVPPSRVNAETINTFLAIAEWLSVMLQRVERARGGRVSEDSYRLSPRREWLGSRSDLGERLLLEYERATRHGAPLSLVSIQFPDWNDLTPAGRRRLDRYVVRRFAHTLRPSDGLYHFGFPGCYVAVLADTREEGAEVVLKRLRSRVGHGVVEPPSLVEMYCTGFDPDAPEVLDLLARLVETYRGRSVLPLGQRCPVIMPQAKLVGTLEQCSRRLGTEVSLAARRGWPLIVIGLHAIGEPDVEPGLLGLHVEAIASDVLRDTDAAFAIGPSHLAIVLAHTTPGEAQVVADRLLDVLRTHQPEPPYGRVDTRLLVFGELFPDAESFLEALSLCAPLSPVAISGV